MRLQPRDYDERDPNYYEQDDGLGALRGVYSAVKYIVLILALTLATLTWVRKDYPVAAVAGLGIGFCGAMFFYYATQEARWWGLFCYVMAVWLFLMALSAWGVFG